MSQSCTLIDCWMLEEVMRWTKPAVVIEYLNGRSSAAWSMLIRLVQSCECSAHSDSPWLIARIISATNKVMSPVATKTLSGFVGDTMSRSMIDQDVAICGSTYTSQEDTFNEVDTNPLFSALLSGFSCSSMFSGSVINACGRVHPCYQSVVGWHLIIEQRTSQKYRHALFDRLSIDWTLWSLHLPSTWLSDRRVIT
jgi:hypothetical protein